jgi:rod shape-determining protein MreC
MYKFLSKNKGLLVLAATILACFLWMTWQFRRPGSPWLVERWVNAAGKPVVSAAGRVGGAFKGVWDGYIYLVGLVDENDRLERQNGSLGRENAQLREYIAKAQRTASLDASAASLRVPFINANAIGRDASSWFKSAWIDAGEEAGVKKDMPAMAAAGIVGRVIKVYGGSSRIMLITDRSSSVSCVTQRTREPGILIGDGESDTCKLQFIGKQADVAPGDLVVTSGLDGIYPAGLPVGRVSRSAKVNQGYFMEIDVIPAASVTKLEEVAVLMYEGPRTAEKMPPPVFRLHSTSGAAK